MVHGSLFSGIGGFDLAADWMGWENAFHCEWNEFGRRVLSHYWPDAMSYNDIKNADFTIWRGKVDIITGGFPCQPYSVAGKRKGKEDDRHLWPEMLRAIREIRPAYVVGENVSGLTNWNEGLVFDEVLSNLENEGYETQSFILPACGVNSPHRRDRLWIVAHAKCNGTTSVGCSYPNERGKETALFQTDKGWQSKAVQPGGLCNILRNVTHTNDKGLQRSKNKRGTSGGGKDWYEQPAGLFCDHWAKFPTQSPVFAGDDGLSSRLDGITLSKWRQESVKAAGNAIVPQVAYQIFKAIEDVEKNS